jgi:hypothetical protein
MGEKNPEINKGVKPAEKPADSKKPSVAPFLGAVAVGNTVKKP